MIYIDVKRAGFDDMVAAGLVLSGGTASLPGICELSELVLRLPVRTGVPRGIHGLSDSLNSPAYATSVGLLHWARWRTARNGHRPKRELHLPAIELSGVFESARKWLKTLIPK